MPSSPAFPPRHRARPAGARRRERRVRSWKRKVGGGTRASMSLKPAELCGMKQRDANPLGCAVPHSLRSGAFKPFPAPGVATSRAKLQALAGPRSPVGATASAQARGCFRWCGAGSSAPGGSELRPGARGSCSAGVAWFDMVLCTFHTLTSGVLFLGNQRVMQGKR